MRPGGPSAFTVSTIRTVSASARYGTRSRPGVPTSTTSIPSGNSQFATSSWTTQGPTASSPIRTLPSPRTRTFAPGIALQRLDPRDLPSLGVESMDCARQTRVERMNGPQHFERTLRIGHGIPDERSFVRAGLVLIVAWTGVPGGRDDGLVVLDLPVLDDDPVREGSAGRLVEAEPALLTFREDGRIEDRRVALPDVVRQELPVSEHGLGDD